MTPPERLPASFRDPSGFLYRRDGELFRQVNRVNGGDYDRLMGSGLAAELWAAGLLIPHDEVDAPPWEPATVHRVIRPEPIPFLSYPYEWCPSALRDAGLLTLEVHRRAIGVGMALKDASAYNVQFRGARPVFIDTLSFEPYREGEPWAAYRQFCQHFLAPLALMTRVDARLGTLLRPHLDGIPLDLASRLLPNRSRLSLGLGLHIHLHAGLQGSHAGGTESAPKRGFGKRAMLGLLDSLGSALRGVRWDPKGPGWAGYVDDNTYSPAARDHKHRLVADFLGEQGSGSERRIAWDLGANTGEYSRVAESKGYTVASFDLDPACVERNYRDASAEPGSKITPLVLDLANPSPAIGWENRERMAILERGPADVAMALALVHHLAIANNVPLGRVAEFLARAGRRLIVEFVPKDDPQVHRLLRSRPDIFVDYDREGFEAAFAGPFATLRAEPIIESGRILYLMEGRGG